MAAEPSALARASIGANRRERVVSRPSCGILGRLRHSRDADLGVQEPNEALPGQTGRGMESWYRYGDSNPGPVAENHVS